MTTVDPLTHKPSEDYVNAKRPLVPEGMYPDMTISDIKSYELDPSKEFNQAKLEKGYTHRVFVEFTSSDGEKNFELPHNWGPDTNSDKLPIYRLQRAVLGADPANWGGLQALLGQKVNISLSHETFGSNEYESPTYTPVG